VESIELNQWWPILLVGRGFDSRWCHWNFSLTYKYSF